AHADAAEALRQVVGLPVAAIIQLPTEAYAVVEERHAGVQRDVRLGNGRAEVDRVRPDGDLARLDDPVAVRVFEAGNRPVPEPEQGEPDGIPDLSVDDRGNPLAEGEQLVRIPGKAESGVHAGAGRDVLRHAEQDLEA